MTVRRLLGSFPSLRLSGSTRVLLVGLVILVIVGWRIEPGRFVTFTNLSVFNGSISVPLFIAIAAAVALLGGVVDLSIGSMAGFGAAVFAIAQSHGTSPWLAAALALCCALTAGAANGIACVWFGADPLITTLGSLTALQGLTLIVLHDSSKEAFIPGFFRFTNQTWHRIPVLLVVTLAVGLVAAVALSFTRYGRHIRAAGGDERSAIRTGIPVPRIRFVLFLLTAAFACVGGIIYVGQDGAAQTTLGMGLELQVYAPILLGGYSLTRGGVGNVMGAVAGVIALGLVSNLLDLRGIRPYWQDIIVGVVILSAVYADRLRGGEQFE